jgi:hypothetical protein
MRNHVRYEVVPAIIPHFSPFGGISPEDLNMNIEIHSFVVR